MNGLCRYSIAHPFSVIGIAVLVTLAVAPGMIRLTIRTDGAALIPHDAPQIAVDREIRDRFDIQDPIVVLIEADHPDGIYNRPTLTLIRDLTEAFRKLENVKPHNVVSLATEKTDRVRTGTLIFRNLLEPFPETDQDLTRIRDDVRAIEIYLGTIVSFDERAAAVLVGVPAGIERTSFHRTISRVVREHHTGPERVHIIGAPVAESLLGTHILEDLGVPDFVLGHSSHDALSRDSTPIRPLGIRHLVAQHVGLVPLAMLIIALVFWIAFRSLAAVALPLTEVGACLMLVFGLMGWLNVPVYLTVTVMPVILTVMGIADEIHIFHRYRRELQQHPTIDAAQAVRNTMDELWRPVTKTSVTTAIAFSSFILSPIGPVRVFGAFTAVGIIICMFWSLTVIPAALAIIPPHRVRPRPAPDGRRPFDLFSRLPQRITQRAALFSGAIVAIALLIAALTPFGLRRLIVQDSWIDGFAPNSDFRLATKTFDDRFLGSHTLMIQIDTGNFTLDGTLEAVHTDRHHLTIPAKGLDDPDMLIGCRLVLRPPEPVAAPDPSQPKRRISPRWESVIDDAKREGDRWIISFPLRSGSPKTALRLWKTDHCRYRITPQRFKRPQLLHRVAAFEDFLRDQRDLRVGGALGPAAYLTTARFMEQARRPGSRAIPDDTNHIFRLWHNLGRIRGTERLRQIVDADYARGLISVYLENSNFVDTKRLIDRIRNYERDFLAPHGISLAFSGDVAVSQTLIDAIVSTQIRSLLLSLGGVFLVTAGLGRSLIWGLLCVTPCALAVLINFAVMGLAGVPLGVATSMFAGMTLGVGVDYAIHLLERMRLKTMQGCDMDTAVTDAVTTVGPAIAIDALAVGLGFGIMTLSQVPANARLAGLLLCSVTACFFATVLLLPAIVRIVRIDRAHFVRPHTVI